MDRIDDLEAFLAIVDKGGQSAAARHLQRSLPSISRSLATLERSVGVALVQRTTRQSHPTEAGRAFHARIKPALAEIAAARAQAADSRRELTGRLRVGAPAQFARAFVMPAVAEFLARFPRVDVELKVSDRPVDLLDAGLDVAVRIRALPDSTMKVRRLGELRLVAYAAKAWLQRHGRPAHPHDLLRHGCVVRTINGADEPWPFRFDGAAQSVRVQGRFRSDDALSLHAAVAEGLGVGFAPLWQISDLVERGVVEVVLQEYETGALPIYAVLPPTRTQPAKVRVFVDLLAARVKGLAM